jgi:hypothetical protein
VRRRKVTEITAEVEAEAAKAKQTTKAAKYNRVGLSQGVSQSGPESNI